MKQEREPLEAAYELIASLGRAKELMNEMTAELKELQGIAEDAEYIPNAKKLIGQKVFLVNKNLEYCEAANIKEATYTEHGALLKLRTILGRCEFRDIEELGKTIFFTQDEALTALKVDEDGNPINTYLTEFIKRFPEYEGREKEITDNVCRMQVFALQGCQEHIEERIPDDCQVCWNQPYKEER